MSEGSYTSSAPLLSWDTTGLPSERVIADARLRLYVTSVQHDDLRSLTGDWYDWGESCDESDNLEYALPHNGIVLARCLRLRVQPVAHDLEADNDFALDDPEAHVQRDGTTTLRLHVAGTPENGSDTVQFAAGASGTPGPRLVLNLCVPTPTPAACQVVVLDPAGGGIGRGIRREFSPAYQSCGESSAALESSWIAESETFQRTTDCLAFDTGLGLISSLPSEVVAVLPDLVITRGWLRLPPLSIWNADGLSLVGDWRKWTCDESDATTANDANALSTAGACGTACQLGTLPASTPIDLPLDALANIHRGDTTYLRVQVDGTPANGRNGVQRAEGFEDEPAAPQLVFEACPPPPTPTPQPGCHIDVFTPDANGWTIAGSDSEEPSCDDDQAFRLAGHLYIAIPPFLAASFGANSLLRWDTSALPADAVIQGASLKAVVMTFRDNDAANLTADWYDWGETCDASDFTAVPLTGALSVDGNCAELCYLKNIPQTIDIEFPLDGADTHLARGPASPTGTPTPALTSLRLSVDLGETPDPSTAEDLFAYADLSGPWSPPRLVVRWCEPTLTPTPTPTPTP